MVSKAPGARDQGGTGKLVLRAFISWLPNTARVTGTQNHQAPERGDGKQASRMNVSGSSQGVPFRHPLPGVGDLANPCPRASIASPGLAGSSGRAPEAGRRKRTDRNGFLQDALGNRRFPSPFSRAMLCAASVNPGLRSASPWALFRHPLRGFPSRPPPLKGLSV